MRSSADVVICGAGVAGIAAAYHLAVRQRVKRVVLIDERMDAMARSVSGFGMGALRHHHSLDDYRRAPGEGFAGQPTGADLLHGDAARVAFPYLSSSTVAALHIRRAGFVNAVALGAW